MKLRALVMIGAASLGVLWFAGCGVAALPAVRREYVVAAMGGEARVVLYAPDEAAGDAGAAAAFAKIAALEAAMSDYREDSELSAVNRAAGGAPVGVGPELMKALRAAKDLSERTDGAFDPTVGAVVKLWRAAFRAGGLPEPRALAKGLAGVGHDGLVLDPAAGTARLVRAGAALDLGGVGKGYAAEEARRVLAARGLPSCLVELGGDFAVGAPPPGRPGWRIGRGDGGEPLVLRDCGVATSGDAYRHVVVDGVRYSHLVDPRTGLGLTDSVEVTVVAEDGGTADALATAVSVLGPSRGFEVLRRFPGASASVTRRDADGAATTLRSEGFP